jgi:hypothetical protein
MKTMANQILDKLNNLFIFDNSNNFPEIITVTEIRDSKFIYEKEDGHSREITVESLLLELLKTKEGSSLVQNAFSNIL